MGPEWTIAILYSYRFHCGQMNNVSHGRYPPNVVRMMIAYAWAEAGVPAKCELCSHETWTVTVTDDLDGISIPVRSGTAPSPFFPPVSYMAYSAECNNCGNLRI